jgi:alkylation response protein AidB-like acyl-CoA dehydrogenase
MVSELCPILLIIELYNFIIKTMTSTETSTNKDHREENCRLINDTVRDFTDIHIKPFIRAWDEEQHFPKDIFKKMGELGLMGMLVPEQYGGAGLGYKEYVTAIIALSRVDPSIGLSMAAHNSLCTNHILMFGDEDQKKKYLPGLTSGEWVGAWGLTEPNTGSDAGNMLTVAVKHDDHWVLNGSKNFITNGRSGDVTVVIARTGQPGDKHGATAFIVEQGMPDQRQAAFGSGR